MEEMKKCPYCANEIKKEAIFCRYCKSKIYEEEPYEFLSIKWNTSPNDEDKLKKLKAKFNLTIKETGYVLERFNGDFNEACEYVQKQKNNKLLIVPNGILDSDIFNIDSPENITEIFNVDKPKEVNEIYYICTNNKDISDFWNKFNIVLSYLGVFSMGVLSVENDKFDTFKVFGFVVFTLIFYSRIRKYKKME